MSIWSNWSFIIQAAPIFWDFVPLFLIEHLKNWKGNGGEREGLTCSKEPQGEITLRDAAGSFYPCEEINMRSPFEQYTALQFSPLSVALTWGQAGRCCRCCL